MSGGEFSRTLCFSYCNFMFQIILSKRIRSITVVLTVIIAAATVFFSACSTHRSDIETTAKAAEILIQDDGDAAVDQAIALINKVPDSAIGYDQLAVHYIKKARQTGDFTLNEKAVSAIEKALEVAPNDDNSRKLKASLLLTYHKFDEALGLGKELNQAAPNDAFVYGILTDANVELGNYDDAVAAAQRMVDLRPNSSSYARVAHLRSLHGDMKGAVEAFKLAARTADPADAEAQSWCLSQLGDEYWKYGKYADAGRTYDEALTILPNYYLALVGKGRNLASQNDLTAAAQILVTATDRIPNVEGAILLGNIYQKLGMNEKAKQQYDLVEVIEAKLGVNNDQKRLALLWADQEINLEKALEITSRESQMRKDVLTYDALAWTLYRLGKFEDAESAISAALRLKSNDARTLFHAGMIQKARGKRAEAKQSLSKALKLNPEFDLLQSDIARSNLLELK